MASNNWTSLLTQSTKSLCSVTILWLLSCGVAQAQVGFSRACNFTEFGPTNQIEYYQVTRQTIDGVPIYQQTADVKTKLWALESITADYASFRYWLLAYSGQYETGQLFRVFQSIWNSRSLYDNNRGLATSVRAGQDFNLISGDSPGLFEPINYYAHEVIGVHYYYDQDQGRFLFIGISRATDCNCPQFGFQLDWANQFANFFCSRF